MEMCSTALKAKKKMGSATMKLISNWIESHRVNKVHVLELASVMASWEKILTANMHCSKMLLSQIWVFTKASTHLNAMDH